MISQVPHTRIVVAFCTAAVVAYLGFSIYVVAWSKDPALTGDVIGTWKSFAVGAFAFWIGSSSGGKSKSDEPQPVTVVNPPAEPVPVSAEPAREEASREGA